MPRNRIQLANNEFYHVVNRGVEQRSIFLDNKDRIRFINSLLVFNDSKAAPWSLRGFWDQNHPGAIYDYIQEDPLVEIHCFCFMENHFHLLLRQIKENGISEFMKKVGGYVSYFNKKYNRKGPLFQGRFKAVLIKTEEQLINTFCYIHTNPVEIIEPGWKDYIVKDKNKANNFVQGYRWSSYGSFIGEGEFDNVIKKDLFLDIFGDENKVKKEISAWISYKASRAAIEKINIANFQESTGSDPVDKNQRGRTP